MGRRVRHAQPVGTQPIGTLFQTDQPQVAVLAFGLLLSMFVNVL